MHPVGLHSGKSVRINAIIKLTAALANATKLFKEASSCYLIFTWAKKKQRLTIKMSKTAFITGATGYIGGQVLYELLSSSIDYKNNAFVRTLAKAWLLVKWTNGIGNVVLGNMDDRSIIKEQVSLSDIVIDTSNVDHVLSVEM